MTARTSQRTSNLRTGEVTRLKVAFWAGSFERAGTQQFLLELLRRIDRSRFEPVVLSTLRVGELLPEIEALGIDVHEFGTGASLTSPATMRQVAAAASFLRRERIDILSCMLGLVTLIGPFVGRMAGVPVVVNNQRNLSYWLAGGAKEAVYRFVNRHLVDAVMVNSSAAASELETRFGTPPEKIVRLAPGVDLSRFDGAVSSDGLRGELGLGASRVVGIVAKLSPVKGHDRFLRAAARIRERRDDVVFLVVGDGPLRSDLESLTAELGIAEAVRFVGVRQDIPEVLGLMDVFVLSSLSEGSPNVILEAMAAGVPVVASNVGGVPDMVRDGETGRLVEPGDPGALADAVLDILSDELRAGMMGRLAQSVVHAEHDIDEVVEYVQQVFEALVAGMKPAEQRRPGGARDRA